MFLDGTASQGSEYSRDLTVSLGVESLRKTEASNRKGLAGRLRLQDKHQGSITQVIICTALPQNWLEAKEDRELLKSLSASGTGILRTALLGTTAQLKASCKPQAGAEQCARSLGRWGLWRQPFEHWWLKPRWRG